LFIPKCLEHRLLVVNPNCVRSFISHLKSEEI
jgi:hypothetical protein